jgi:hypothetical protein
MSKKAVSRVVASTSNIVDQIAAADLANLPILIDFEGFSLYHCDARVQAPPSVQDPSPPSQLKLNFDKLFERIVAVQAIRVRYSFAHWKEEHDTTITARLRYYIGRWKIRSRSREERLEQFRTMAIAILRYWRFISLQRRVIEFKKRHMKQRSLNIWRRRFVERHQGVKVRRFARLRVRKYYLRRWWNRLKKVQMDAKEAKVTDSRSHSSLSGSFDGWRSRHLASKGKIRDRIRRKFFDRWRAHYQQISETTSVFARFSQRLVSIFFQRWIKNHRRRVSHRSATQRNTIAKWGVMALRLTGFTRIKAQANRIGRAFSFRKWVANFRRVSKARQAVLMRRWRQFARDGHQIRRVEAAGNRGRVISSFAKWRSAFRDESDKGRGRLVREAVLKSRLRKGFRKLAAAVARRERERDAKATAFAGRSRQLRVFRAWMGRSKWAADAAVAQERVGLALKFIRAWAQLVRVRIAEREQRLRSASVLRLKRRMFQQMMGAWRKKAPASRETVVDLLRGGSARGRLTRISYI